MLRPLFIGTVCSIALSVSGQEQFGLSHSNYAGTDALALNPARMATQWCWMDINLIGAGAFIWNDHVYMSGNDRSLLGEMGAGMRGADGGKLNFYESLSKGGRQGFVNGHIALPAVALNLGKNSIGAHVTTRTALSLTGVGNGLARFAYNGMGYTPQHGYRYNDDRPRIAGGAWTQFGASFARLLVAREKSLLSAGITAKYLMAHMGGGLGFQAFDYSVLDTARAEVYEASGSYGYAAPAMNAGRGWGSDIGVTYERTLGKADGYVPHGSCDPMPYRYRIGVSLIDVGGMRFRGGTAGGFQASTANFPDYNDIVLDSEEDADSLLAASLSTYQRGQGFKLGLPTALSVHYDHRITDHVYIAAGVVQNLAFGDDLRMRRPNSIAVVPRYERMRFEAAVPLVIHEYDPRRPSLGLMLRLNNVVLGSDNLLSLVSRRGIFGTDVYCRIKWTLFRGPACKGGNTRVHKAGVREAMPCKFPQ